MAGFFPIVGFGLSAGLLAATVGFGRVIDGLVGEGVRVMVDRGLGRGVGRDGGGFR